ncbi:hypothetical protein [Halobacillus amylolyticus]|uniref:Lycopene cyclase domain-containing protein n=1 Tax=Halobacillus amylolyticus TaxID=2932259 RepID=A0ABY4HBR9_9BACI|nr:hypothetical protein [Halobacillus amylolyticus]UOR10865.1 hypothetical protein MUO15_14780 [Halobacillus amylolyticus]
MNIFLLVLALILPWTLLFFFEKKTIKRYMPVTIFTALLMTIIFQIAYTYEWWIIHEYIVPWGYMIDVSFAYGCFAVGTFMIFYFTSHKFWLYLLVNLVTDAFFGFVILGIVLKKMGVAEYKTLSGWQYWLIICAVNRHLRLP